MGLVFLAFLLAVFTLGCCEIKTIKKRDDALKVEISMVTSQAL